MHNDEADPKATPDTAAPDPGKVYQAVAQSEAIGIQDAADALRNLTTIDATAEGIALAEMLEQRSPAIHSPDAAVGAEDGDEPKS